ncbi:hypothetical protein L4C34_11840 [Vibrio profundum]|uniref:hypothetical protein n=1 Tax=Vibrio profundum TaxID=2910247 RepID=UPI003D0DE4AA
MKKVVFCLSSLLLSSLAHASPYTVYCHSFANDSHKGDCSFYEGVPTDKPDAVSVTVKLTCLIEPYDPPAWTVTPDPYTSQFTVGDSHSGCSSSQEVKSVQITFKQSDGRTIRTSKVVIDDGGGPYQSAEKSDQSDLLGDDAKKAGGKHIYVSNWSKPVNAYCWHVDGYSGCAKDVN